MRYCENKNGMARQATVGNITRRKKYAICMPDNKGINTPYSMLVALSAAKMIRLTRLSAMFYVHCLYTL